MEGQPRYPGAMPRPRRVVAADYAYPVGAVAVLVLVAGLLLGIYGEYRVQRYQEVQRALAERVVLGVAHEARSYLDELHRDVQLFAAENADLITRAADRPEDVDAYRRLEQKVSRQFPDFVAFAVSDPQGHLRVDDFEGWVGEVCQDDIRLFLQQPGIYDTYVHPTPGSYHFDVMVPRYDRSGAILGVFFVSFKPVVLTRLLRNATIPGYELLLVRGAEPYLIEMTAQGTRDQLPPDDGHRLSRVDLSTAVEARVPSTQWTVLARPSPGLLDAQIREVWWQVGVAYLLLSAVVLGLGGIWVWRRRLRHEADESLRVIAEGVGRSTGEDFFRALTRSLSLGLGVRYAYLAEVVSEDPLVLKPWSLWDGRAAIEIEGCEVDATPCEDALSGGPCLIARNLAQRFPQATSLRNLGADAFLGVPLADSGGRPLGVLALIHDHPLRHAEHKLAIVEILATRAGAELERLRVQEALQRSEANYRTLVETSRDLIWSVDREGRLSYVNQSVRALLGYEPEEVIGLHSSRLFAPESLQDHKLALDEALAGRPIEDQTFECVHRDGGRRTLLVNALPRYDDRGEVVAVSGTATDVTDFFPAQRAIKTKSEIFSAILSKLPVFFFRVDGEGVISDIRGDGLERLGVAADTLIGTPISQLFQGEERRIEAALRGRTELFEVRGASGQAVWWCTVSMFFDHWRGSGAIGFAVDATERKFAEEKLVQMVRENRRLARRLVEVQEDERTNLARELHDELGQSITAVKSLATAISRLDEDRLAEVKRLGGSIVSLSGHLYDVVKNIMYRLRPDIIDSLGIEEALKACIDKSQLETMGVVVALDMKGDIAGLDEVVQVSIYRIVQECLTNIVKYAMASNVSIRISRSYLPVTERRRTPRVIPGAGESSHQLPANLFRDTLTIIVSDDGVGMDLRASLDRESRGTPGFGLQGIRERVTALGGRVDILSESGRGVQVTVTIDLETHCAAKEARPEAPAPQVPMEEVRRR